MDVVVTDVGNVEAKTSVNDAVTVLQYLSEKFLNTRFFFYGLVNYIHRTWCDRFYSERRTIFHVSLESSRGPYLKRL